MGFRRFWIGALLLAVPLGGCGEARSDAPRGASLERRAELQDAIADNPQAIAERVELARVAIRLGDGDHLHAYFTRTRAIRRGIIEAGQDTAAPDFGRVALAAPKGG